MAYYSLTDVPSNFKEGIDWLLALKGDDPHHYLQAMGTALHDLLSRHYVGFTRLPALEKIKLISRKFLEEGGLKGQPFVKELLERYKAPMSKNPEQLAKVFSRVDESDYKNVVRARRATPRSIAKNIGEVVDAAEKFLEGIKETDKYTNTYGSGATWIGSCADDPEACAVVFVGIAPMLYAGLRSLQEASLDAQKEGPHSDAANRLGKMFKALGYEERDCIDGLKASDIRKALEGVNKQILAIVYNIAGFWAFY
ncbi:hypothetical protein, conserved [Babesia ovata]|uniref:Uncharacterized protein n=1 Tax=Babesia ovata TaxID=189622 RepID=A0A2H6K9B5_9APIC|nr:uncharacterized protein BOVATA_010730 [Babesia ovata]GBE59580.1 hypothetical protein, conserved [Babesia ovata]